MVFHGCCCSFLLGLNKVVLATWFVLRCYSNNVICYYGSFISAFKCSNKLVLVVVICTMMSSKRCYLLPISILYTTILSKQGWLYLFLLGWLKLNLALLLDQLRLA